MIRPIYVVALWVSRCWFAWRGGWRDGQAQMPLPVRKPHVPHKQYLAD